MSRNNKSTRYPAFFQFLSNTTFSYDSHETHYGYKSHISIDRKHKVIRKYAITSAEVHDSQVFEELLDENNSNGSVWADSAYRSHTHRKSICKRPSNEREQ
ncbi:transposase [Candidatus Vondammii sp. HM_W22]|uniref:transposase n=1 Tax=Candidatus Vondammii sp. HM_W22 TaxID=2687299 RepID=UPI001F1371B4|nr:transposase [Candidatus Vondammii sp. HM_W22]